LRNFGLKVGMVGTVKFEARIKELVENLPDLAELVEPLLIVRRVVRAQLGILHRHLLAIVRDDDVHLMMVRGSGLLWSRRPIASPSMCRPGSETPRQWVRCLD